MSDSAAADPRARYQRWHTHRRMIDVDGLMCSCTMMLYDVRWTSVRRRIRVQKSGDQSHPHPSLLSPRFPLSYSLPSPFAPFPPSSLSTFLISPVVPSLLFRGLFFFRQPSCEVWRIYFPDCATVGVSYSTVLISYPNSLKNKNAYSPLSVLQYKIQIRGIFGTGVASTDTRNVDVSVNRRFITYYVIFVQYKLAQYNNEV